jgi:5-methylcytosine-specific restriction endonuclease McrA
MHEAVLVLNANFEPINICTTRRAVVLIICGKADMVANGRGYVHTVSLAIPRPSVIRLDHQVRRPRPRIKLSRREVFRRDSYVCQYCGHHDTRLTVDHVVPRYQGGLHVWTNVVAACSSCNHRKGGRSPEQAHMRLRRVPREPSASAAYVFGRHLADNEEWREYIRGW